MVTRLTVYDAVAGNAAANPAQSDAPSLTPSDRPKVSFASTIRASICTCRTGVSISADHRWTSSSFEGCRSRTTGLSGCRYSDRSTRRQYARVPLAARVRRLAGQTDRSAPSQLSSAFV